MSLLNPADRETVRRHLEGLVHPVTLLFFSQTFGAGESIHATRQILGELTALSDRLTVEEVNFVLDKDRATAFGIEGAPAIAVLRESTDTRMRFLGAPAGYEFMSLVEAIVVAGSDAAGLAADTLELLSTIDSPLDIRVFVTPTCPHCPRAVSLAHKLAAAHPLVTATCVEATEFLELSRQFRVTGVPKTVVNGTTEILGSLPEYEFVRAILGRPLDEEAAIP